MGWERTGVTTLDADGTVWAQETRYDGWSYHDRWVRTDERRGPAAADAQWRASRA